MWVKCAFQGFNHLEAFRDSRTAEYFPWGENWMCCMRIHKMICACPTVAFERFHGLPISLVSESFRTSLGRRYCLSLAHPSVNASVLMVWVHRQTMKTAWYSISCSNSALRSLSLQSNLCLIVDIGLRAPTMIEENETYERHSYLHFLCSDYSVIFRYPLSFY